MKRQYVPGNPPLPCPGRGNRARQDDWPTFCHITHLGDPVSEISSQTYNTISNSMYTRQQTKSVLVL